MAVLAEAAKLKLAGFSSVCGSVCESIVGSQVFFYVGGCQAAPPLSLKLPTSLDNPWGQLVLGFGWEQAFFCITTKASFFCPLARRAAAVSRGNKKRYRGPLCRL